MKIDIIVDGRKINVVTMDADDAEKVKAYIQVAKTALHSPSEFLSARGTYVDRAKYYIDMAHEILKNLDTDQRKRESDF